jgi:hypothetical protein
LGVKKTGCGNVIAVPILEETLQGELIMMKMTELIGHELQWKQPSVWKREYELCTGDIIAATLRFPGFFDTATAASADGSWTFKGGYYRTKVTVRASGAETDLAVLKWNTWSTRGTLELPDGRKYLANRNFWSWKLEFKTETGDALISYRKIGGRGHKSSWWGEIHALAKEVPEMPWMVLLWWYLTILLIRAFYPG